MNPVIKKNYHFILLGGALLVALGTGIYLTMASSELQNSLGVRKSSLSSQRFAGQPIGEPAKALEILSKPADWKLRQDGASPYVSRPYLLKEGALLDPLLGDTPLYPPVPNKWLADHALDFSDVNILEKDPKHKGFTVLDDYLAGTDPNDSAQLPPLCVRLFYQEPDLRKTVYDLEFLGEEENEGQKQIQIKPATAIPNPARNNKPDTSVRLLSRGDTVPGAPLLKVVDLIPKKTTLNDTEYDVSELVLQNTLTGERHVLVMKNVSKEYRKTPIQVIEGVRMTYQPAGAPPRDASVDLGKTLSLSSLDNTKSETYRFTGITQDGLTLEKDGKTYTVKAAAAPSSPQAPAPNP
jgi:hypothetical protein